MRPQDRRPKVSVQAYSRISTVFYSSVVNTVNYSYCYCNRIIFIINQEDNLKLYHSNILFKGIGFARSGENHITC